MKISILIPLMCFAPRLNNITNTKTERKKRINVVNRPFKSSVTVTAANIASCKTLTNEKQNVYLSHKVSESRPFFCPALFFLGPQV